MVGLPFLVVPLALAVAGVPAVVEQDPAIQLTPAEELARAIIAIGSDGSRMTVPVSIANRGPYRFIIDTGAERTVISRELARSLNLVSGGPVNVIAMSGRSSVQSVMIPSLTFSSVPSIGAIKSPALGAMDLGGLGLLGIDTLRDHVIEIDFDANTMAVAPSTRRDRKRSSDGDEIVVTAKSQLGQLIVTDAEFDGRMIRVVIDTGSPISIGNSAMRRLVMRTTGKMNSLELTSATGVKMQADYAQVGKVRLGPLAFGGMPVAFSDVAPFERFGLSKRPAMLLGMSALRSFRRVEIDFANRQIRFKMPRDWRRGYRCNTYINSQCAA